MLGELDHVGYLTRDLEGAVARVAERLGLAVARRFERAQYSLHGVYMGAGGGNVELFCFTDPELAAARLGEHELLLDHVAYRVQDIDTVAAELRSAGVRFCGPDFREELVEAVDLGGVRHLWTRPETSCGQSIQLLQP